VNLLDERVLAQPRAHVAAAIHDAHEALVDERVERLFEERPQVFVDRVHLEHADLALGDQLVEHV
jgi:hypothetical protein